MRLQTLEPHQDQKQTTVHSVQSVSVHVVATCGTSSASLTMTVSWASISWICGVRYVTRSQLRLCQSWTNNVPAHIREIFTLDQQLVIREIEQFVRLGQRLLA